MAALHVKVALIISSTRTPRVGSSIAPWVISAIMPTLPSTVVLDIVDLADYPLPLSPSGSRIPSQITSPGVPVPKGAYGNNQIDSWSQKIAGFDGFVFLTPQYNWSIPGVLKVSLDHLFHEWVGKPVMIVSYGGRGGGKAAAALSEIWKGLRGGECVGVVELVLVKTDKGMEMAQTMGELDESLKEAWEKDGKAELVQGCFAKLVDVLQQKR